jgi:hypothetical protein
LFQTSPRRGEASLRAVGEVIPKDSAKPISFKKHYIFNATIILNKLFFNNHPQPLLAKEGGFGELKKG